MTVEVGCVQIHFESLQEPVGSISEKVFIDKEWTDSALCKQTKIRLKYHFYPCEFYSL